MAIWCGPAMIMLPMLPMILRGNEVWYIWWYLDMIYDIYQQWLCCQCCQWYWEVMRNDIYDDMRYIWYIIYNSNDKVANAANDTER